MTTFYGSYEHSVDGRGRIAVPARYRPSFALGGVVRAGPDGCVELYAKEGFDNEMALRLGEQESTRERRGRRIRRGFMPSGFDVDLDRQGRVLLPQALRTECDLDDRATIIGCGDYIEIWNPGRWELEQQALAAEESEATDAAGGGA